MTLSDPVPRSSRLAGLWALLAVVGGIAAFAGLTSLAAARREALLEAACRATLCTAAGMATTGWLTIALPAGLIGACAAFWQRLPKPGRALLLAVTLASGWIAARGFAAAEGPGSAQVAAGVMAR